MFADRMPRIPREPLTSGVLFDAQAWFHDSAAPKGLRASDAAEWSVGA